jgi:hypothetical protein
MDRFSKEKHTLQSLGLEMAKNDEAKRIAYRRELTPVGIVCKFFVYIARPPSRFSVTSYVLVETKFL